MAGNLGAVRGLLAHPAFAMSNPNMCYSMFLSFLRSTPTFHAADGSGYAFLADSILQARAAAQSALVTSAVSACIAVVINKAKIGAPSNKLSICLLLASESCMSVITI